MRRPMLVAMIVLVSWSPARAGVPAVVLAWNAGGSTSGYLTQAAGAPGLNTLSPWWWTLRPDGSVADSGDRRYVDWARGRGMRLWPLFTNSSDQDATHRVLTDDALRAAVIARVGDLAAMYTAGGVNVDWENMRVEDRDAFSAFVREAAEAWRARGLVVSVDVTPRTDTWQLGNWSESFDRAAIGASADLLVLMAYDEHNRLRPNGPTASLPWVVESIEYVLRDVPASKVLLGLPLYMRDWSDDPKRPMETLTVSAAPSRLRAYGATARWDDALGLTYATYVRDGHEHRVWVEDERSLALKVALVDRYGLAGVAAWRLGFGTESAWRVLSGASAPAPAPAVPARAAPAAPSPAPPSPSPTRPPSPLVTPATLRAAGVSERGSAPTRIAPAALAAAVLLLLCAAPAGSRSRRRLRRPSRRRDVRG